MLMVLYCLFSMTVALDQLRFRRISRPPSRTRWLNRWVSDVSPSDALLHRVVLKRFSLPFRFGMAEDAFEGNLL